MSQREFGTYLGYAQSTVVNWEKEGRTAHLHHETREVSNRDLDGLSRERREEFDRKLMAAIGRFGDRWPGCTTEVVEVPLADPFGPLTGTKSTPRWCCCR